MEKQRLQKIIAHAGYCSRRKAEELIEQGKVKVNGKRASIGESATEKDEIIVNGEKITKQNKVYYVLNKPKEVMVTKDDPEKRITVYTLPNVQKIKENINTVGRLDFMSEGLLILTNDGDFANKVTHPRYNVKKRYYVRVEPEFKAEDLDAIEDGIEIDGKVTKGTIKEFSENAIEITIKEGRNRIIRKMMETLGYTVYRLRRTQIGTIKLGNLKAGEIRELNEREIDSFN